MAFNFENLASRCLELRVDFLDEDELKHELIMRKVIPSAGQEKSLSRSRRILREMIKQEKATGLFSKVLPNTPEEELSICQAKLIKIESLLGGAQDIIRLRSTLLHLANRLLVLIEHSNGGILEKAEKLVQRVLLHLNHFFGDTITLSSAEHTGDEEEDEEASDNRASNSVGGCPSLGPTSPNTAEQEFVEFFKRLGISSEDLGNKPDSIKNALTRIENELKHLRQYQEMARRSSTDTENTVVGITPTTDTGAIPKVTQVASYVTTYSYPRPIITSAVAPTAAAIPRIPSPGAQQTAIPWPQSPLPPIISTSTVMYEPPQFASSYPSHASWPTVQQSGRRDFLGYSGGVPPTSLADYLHRPIPPLSVPYSSPLPPMAPNTGFPSVTSQPGSIPPYGYPGYRTAPTTRRTIPVSQWSIEKYSGSDQGMRLNEFLGLVEQLSMSEKVEEDELFDSAFHLFTGPAANWYMSMRSSGRLLNWQHLVRELRKTFVHPELDTLVRSRIYQRRQQRNESFQDFYFDVDKMFRSMITPMDDREKLDILRRNLRSDYKKALLWKPVQDLPQLIEAGHVIDASNFSMYQKVFGTEKSVNLIAQKNPSHQSYSNSRQQKSHIDQAEPWKPSKSKQVPGPPEKQPSLKGNEHCKPHSDARPSKPFNPGEGTSKPNRTLDFLVAGFKPPTMDVCLNCRQPDHQIEQCRVIKGLICYVCGFKGFDSQNCPYCKKHGLHATDNQRAGNKSA